MISDIAGAVMIKALVVTLVLLAIAPGQSAQAGPEITANALFEDKAVLKVDGKPVFLSVGEQKRGIKLIDADELHAEIEIDGQRRTLYLDKTIAKEYAGPEEIKRHRNAKSHVISASLIHQTPNLATFEVDYYYNKNLADYVTLEAKTLHQNEDTGYWEHSFTPLKPGRHITTITISMNDKAPPSYQSDAIRFNINWVDGQRSGTVGSKIIPFAKYWRQN